MVTPCASKFPILLYHNVYVTVSHERNIFVLSSLVLISPSTPCPVPFFIILTSALYTVTDVDAVLLNRISSIASLL